MLENSDDPFIEFLFPHDKYLQGKILPHGPLA